MATKNINLTQAEVQQAFHYDPYTGIFTWNDNPNQHPAINAKMVGKVAGTTSTHKGGRHYRYISIYKTHVAAHRLAWMYVHGEWPPDDIDHIDGNGLNNRIDNLRKATRTQNVANKTARKDSKLGLKGVSKRVHNKTNPYAARIKVNGKQKHLGYFPTPEQAHAAYMEAAIECYGEFASA